MAGRSSTTFKKRQKEMARMEKQRDKAAKRMQRKLNPKETGDVDEPADLSGEEGLPGEEGLSGEAESPVDEESPSVKAGT